MAGALKKTTGLTGLAVAKQPHYVLGVLYNKILRAIRIMPEHARYRQATESLITEKLALVEKEKDIAKLEEKLGFQVEESILQAENELILARKFLQWKPWEPLQTPAPPDQWRWPM
ncbi:hypothetical protein BIW11_11831 [Tropilaelaps mercedesae]|uniref:Uncharacterized protein n=1 Tax=Tropilaelaps mercedesae TaxID=418985 RepID=A0A1V9X9B1_9ACAR|nr:hypothetical protein BIW11_11831 [Tropilaelaps mercedesae]